MKATRKNRKAFRKEQSYRMRMMLYFVRKHLVYGLTAETIDLMTRPAMARYSEDEKRGAITMDINEFYSLLPWKC